MGIFSKKNNKYNFGVEVCVEIEPVEIEQAVGVTFRYRALI